MIFSDSVLGVLNQLGVRPEPELWVRLQMVEQQYRLEKMQFEMAMKSTYGRAVGDAVNALRPVVE